MDEQKNKHGYAEHFSELVVWQKSRSLAKAVFELSQGFPDEERFALTDQIRRSSRSIGAQIAEAWAKRRYERHFVSKLTDSDGEQNETQHWLIIAMDAGYVDRATAAELGNACKDIGAMIGKMIATSGKFCGGSDTDSSVLRDGDLSAYDPDGDQ